MAGGMGFAPAVQADTKPRLDEKLEKMAAEAAKRKFAPQFMNRIDKVVVFHPLRSEQLEGILEIELGMVQKRVLETAKGRFLFRVMPAAREFLLREGTDLKYGARHLKRAIERHVVCPLATLLATDQVSLGDVISINWSGIEPRLVFSKETEGAIVTSNWPVAEALQKPVVRHSDGRAIVFPPSCGSDALKLLRENRPSGMESIPAARVRSEEWQ